MAEFTEEQHGFLTFRRSLQETVRDGAKARKAPRHFDDDPQTVRYNAYLRANHLAAEIDEAYWMPDSPGRRNDGRWEKMEKSLAKVNKLLDALEAELKRASNI